jgi:creatinine deaminase
MDVFFKYAIDEAKMGLKEGGIPIGSILVRNGKVIGRGHNMRVQKNDPTAHAEIECLRNSGRIGTYTQTVLYSTLMPCYLFAGAIVQFGIRRVIVGESRNFGGAKGFMQSQDVEIADLDSAECIEMMRTFILNNSDLWYEDIGKK